MSDAVDGRCSPQVRLVFLEMLHLQWMTSRAGLDGEHDQDRDDEGSKEVPTSPLRSAPVFHGAPYAHHGITASHRRFRRHTLTKSGSRSRAVGARRLTKLDLCAWPSPNHPRHQVVVSTTMWVRVYTCEFILPHPESRYHASETVCCGLVGPHDPHGRMHERGQRGI